MMQHVVCFFALVAVCVSAFPMLEDDAHKCKPAVPYMKNLQGHKYAGKWYVDSSVKDAWLHSICNEYDYKWHQGRHEESEESDSLDRGHHHHHHHHHRHSGHFTFKLREINEHHGQNRDYCWTACATESKGFLNGSLTDASHSNCSFKEELERHHHHHHKSCPTNQKPNWSQWVIHTDYKRYSLVWLCTKNKAYVTLQSRSKHPLSAAIRKKAQNYLDNHGYKHKLKPADNSGC